MSKKFFNLKSELGEFKVEVEISFGQHMWTVKCNSPQVSSKARSKERALEQMKDELVKIMVGGYDD